MQVGFPGGQQLSIPDIARAVGGATNLYKYYQNWRKHEQEAAKPMQLAIKRGRAGNTVSAKKRQLVRPGYTRLSGYYGRFNGPRAEKKFHDAVDTLSIPDGGSSDITTTILQIPQGDGENERIGRRAYLKDLTIHATVSMDAFTGNIADVHARVCRLIMYLDKQTNGAAATANDLLESNTSTAFTNLENRDRFTFLVDKKIILNPVAMGGTNIATAMPEQKQYARAYKKCDIPIEYSGATGVLSEMKSNNIGVLFLTDTVRVPGDPGVHCAFLTRVRYYN